MPSIGRIVRIIGWSNQQVLHQPIVPAKEIRALLLSILPGPEDEAKIETGLNGSGGDPWLWFYWGRLSTEHSFLQAQRGLAGAIFSELTDKNHDFSSKV